MTEVNHRETQFLEALCVLLVLCSLPSALALSDSISSAANSAWTDGQEALTSASQAPTAGTAAAAAGITAPELKWFEQHIASRCFAPKGVTWVLGDSTTETVLRRQTQFFGVYQQGEGFFYHYITTSKQAEYSISNGARTQTSKVHDSI